MNALSMMHIQNTNVRKNDFKCNTELHDLRIIICLRKHEITVERISVFNVIEKLMEHDIYCLPYFYTNDVIDLLL